MYSSEQVSNLLADDVIMQKQEIKPNSNVFAKKTESQLNTNEKAYKWGSSYNFLTKRLYTLGLK